MSTVKYYSKDATAIAKDADDYFENREERLKRLAREKEIRAQTERKRRYVIPNRSFISIVLTEF